MGGLYRWNDTHARGTGKQGVALPGVDRLG